MKKMVCCIMLLVLLVGICGSCYAEVVVLPAMPVIGIAWRTDTDSEFFINTCRAVEEAGGTWVLLDQVLSADLRYDERGNLVDGVTEKGSLSTSAAELVRCNTWAGSNAEEAVRNVNIVLFTGGEDISPALYSSSEMWPELEEEDDFNAERDVSDYLTMSYCLDHDIPVLGICRGMQMLSVVSGAEIIRNIPDYFEALSLEYGFEHRNEVSSPDAYRDYTPHEVQVVKDSLLYDMVGSELLEGCPSWHHQAVGSVKDTPLVMTGYTDTNGVQMIEAVERTDKTFAVGLQFHPEAAVVKHLEHAENEDDFMDYDTALSIFRWIAQERFVSQEAAA